METLKNIKFQHDPELFVWQAIGLTEEEKSLLCQWVDDAAKRLPTITEVLEDAIKEFEGKNLLWVIFSMSNLIPDHSDLLGALFKL